MKRLLLILVVFAVTIPASAEVFVYNSKQSGTTISYDWGTWAQYKDTETSFVIVESTSDTTAGIWVIAVWQYKDKSGQKTKYAQAESVGEVDFIRTLIGKKTMWIISARDSNSQTMLSGQAKQIKLGSQTIIAASTLSGVSISEEAEFVNERDFSTGSMTMKLNTKLTTQYYQSKGGDTMESILGDLVAQGYEDVSNP
jgi:hypothetical protein